MWDVGVLGERACDAAREEVAIDREGGARGNFRGVGLAHDDRAERPHLAVEQTDGIAVAIVAAEAVRAEHLGERVALMRSGELSVGQECGSPRNLRWSPDT